MALLPKVQLKFSTSIPGGNGAPGPAGPAGTAATVDVGSTTMLTPGATPTVTGTGTSVARILNFGLPEPVSVDDANVNGLGHLQLHLNDGATIDAGNVRGDTGPPAAGAHEVASFAGISSLSFPTVGLGGPNLLYCRGYYEEGDCWPFYAIRRDALEGDLATVMATNYWGKLVTKDLNDVMWEYRYTGAPIHFRHTGARVSRLTGDTWHDIVPYFEAFKKFFLDKWWSDNNFWYPKLDFTIPQSNNATVSGVTWFWYQASTLQLKNGSFHLYADGSGQSGGSTATIVADVGYTQVILDDHDTEMGDYLAPADRLYPGASGSIIEGLTFNRHSVMTTDPDAEYDGILARCRFDMRRCAVSDAARAGLFVYGNVAAGSGGNANCFSVTDCLFNNNRQFGIWTFGSDANAGSFNGTNSCARNGCGGIFDQSFLGNAYSGQIHLDGNAYDPRHPAPYPMTTRYGNKVYRVVPRQNVAASTTTPGTNNGVWEYWYNEAGPDQWVTGQTWLFGADIIVTNSNARNGFFNVYCEGGGWPIYMIGPSILHDGGCRDAVQVSSNSTSMIWKDNKLLTGKFTTKTLDDALDGSAYLEVTHGGRGTVGKHNILSAKRNKSNSTLAQMNIRSYGDGTFGADGVTNENIARANASWLWLGPTDFLGEESDLTANAQTTTFQVPYLMIGPDGYGRGLSNYAGTARPTSGPRGSFYFQRLPRKGGELGRMVVAGDDTAVFETARAGYIEWSVAATYDPPSLTAGSVSPTQTISAPGVVLGDQVAFTAFSRDLQGVRINAWVSAADVVSYRFENTAGASTVDLASGTVTLYLRRANESPNFTSLALTPPVSLDFASNYDNFTIYGSNASYVIALNPSLASIVSGKLRLTSAAGSSSGWYPTASVRLNGLTVGETYRVGFDYSGSAGTQRVRVGANALGLPSPILDSLQAAASGTFVDSFTATNTTHFLALNVDAETAGVVGDFDNLTVAVVAALTLPVSETFSNFDAWEIFGLNTAYAVRSNRSLASIVSGALRLTVGSASSTVYGWYATASAKVGGLTPGAKYLFSISYANATSGAALLRIGPNSGGFPSPDYEVSLPGTSGSITSMFTASAATAYFAPGVNSETPGDKADFDNITIAAATTSGDATLPVSETFSADYGRWSIYGLNSSYLASPNASLAQLLSGKLRLTSGLAANNAWYPTASLHMTGLTIGHTYNLSVGWVASNSGHTTVRVGDGAQAYPSPIMEGSSLSGTSGTYTNTFTATATDHYLAISIEAEDAQAGYTLDIDNVSVTA